MNFNFGEVLTRAWQITWKHKVLWIFGILASCGRGGSGGNSGGNNTGFQSEGPDFNIPPQIMRWFQMIEENLPPVIITVCVVVLLIWIVTIFLSTIGKIGLIRGAFQADGGAESLIFGQLFSESMPYFWRVFGLSILLSLPILLIIIPIVILVILGVASTASEGAAFGFLGFVPVFIGCICLLIPVMFVLGIVFRQADNAIVLEELSVLPAISRGWEVFRANLGPIILMAIILAVIGFVAGLVIAVPLLLVVFPAMLAFFASEAQNTTPLILMGVCICLYIPVSLVLNGIALTYTESAWTLTYMRLTNKPNLDDPIKLISNDPLEPEDPNQTVISTRSNA